MRTVFRFSALLVAVVLCGCQTRPALAPEMAAAPLDILVFGASGKIGGHVVDEALARGHTVTAVSRDPARIERRDPQLRVERGDILDPTGVGRLVAGQDVVVVSVRGVVGDVGDPENAVALKGLRTVIAAVRESAPSATRVIHVGGAGSLEVAPGRLLADALPGLFLDETLETEIAAQVRALDYLRGVYDVAWTYITPPKVLNDQPRSGRYRVGGDRLMEDEHGANAISRADFAVALVDEAEQGRFVRQRFSVVREP